MNPTHGLRATYIKGCRCEQCTEANGQYQKDYIQRKARLSSPHEPPPIVEGDTTWIRHGACRVQGVPTYVFFPGRGSTEGVEEAKAICATCTVADDCLNYALATRQAFGVWGGTSEYERRKVRSVVARAS